MADADVIVVNIADSLSLARS